MELQELKPSHRSVMRIMALGRNTLKEICEAHKLNYQSWLAISNSTLFKAELERMTQEIDARVIEEASSDPVRVQLLAAGERAAKRLATEVDNLGEDASASTRIKASESILDRLGYSQRQEESKPQQVIVLNISASKLSLMQGLASAKNLKALGSENSEDTAGLDVQPGTSNPAVPVLVEA